jgi:adenylyltransferase/sulfurtransferase
MSTCPFKRPRLPTHYYIRFEPPDRSGEEVLFVSSERRRIRLRGRSFREFLQFVVPLLDGNHSVWEVKAQVASVFDPDELDRFLNLLAEYNILQDAETDAMPVEVQRELEPQLNFFHELGLKPREVQERLRGATVVVWGLAGPGAAAALALAAAQVGHLRCVDESPVTYADALLAPSFSSSDLGRNRSEVMCAQITERCPRVSVRAYAEPVKGDSDALRILEGSDLVVCCTDPGMASHFYILNRACLHARISWTSCAVSGFEGIIGPTVVPFETACYVCYKMRCVAAAPNPEYEFSHERFLDQRKQDDSGRRENHAFGTGAIGNLVGLEAIKCLTRMVEPSALGRIVVVDLLTLACRKHSVLRKPWCPACCGQGSKAVHGVEPQAGG